RWSEPEHGRGSGATHEERSTGKNSSKSGHKAHDETASERRQAEEAVNSGKKVRYTVQEGDTLFSIARRNDMEVDELKKMNHLADADDILVGQNIQVWGKEAAQKLPLAKTGAGFKSSQSLKHTVREGETLFSLSRRFNVTVADLRKWNAIKGGKSFRAGMNITVYADKD
ncbi:MAG: LysM peptidoglycan-binding domain-containing protein, partial [Methylococcaceae bacterium]|nr:LysM peptidoglycan-binding domain-containing protein [Methylococcaceae bacterium]